MTAPGKTCVLCTLLCLWQRLHAKQHTKTAQAEEREGKGEATLYKAGVEAELSTQRTQAAGSLPHASCATQFGANKLAQTTEILFCCSPAPQCAF